jgi:NADPH:quinone reductase
MYRIVRIHRTGGPEVLQFENVEAPSPGPGEVTIEVKALGLNRAEAMFRAGSYTEATELPARLGYEAAGTIIDVGANVTGFAPGDAVSTIPSLSVTRWGTYGEIATLQADLVVKHPACLSWTAAAATWMQYVTAYGALCDIAALRRDDFVIVTAASSSTGLAAIQIARLAGAIPIATTRGPSKKAALLEAGAAHVIVTAEEDLPDRIGQITGGKGARVVFDPIGGPGFTKLIEAMSSGGVLIEYGALDREPVACPLFSILAKMLTVRGYRYKEIVSDRRKLDAAKSFILEGILSGGLKPIVAKTFPLDRIVDAHRYLESNQQFGKIVVEI